ncbi:TPA: HNH endonuclease [Photobacterium damselae]
MNIWRLIAHHEHALESIKLMKKQNCVAIGWSDTGDLTKVLPNDQSEITSLINMNYPNLDNAHLGGPSLWNLYRNMKEGDFVIVNANGRRDCVFEITGPYIFNPKAPILGYMHQRQAMLTSISAEKLWLESGAVVQKGQNIRWTLASCKSSRMAEDLILKEGTRFSVTSNAVERNPLARQKCIDHYGYICAACQIDMEAKYGIVGKGFIHVHHRTDLALTKGVHVVDPVRDLIPLCPNCHAMVHRDKPAMAIDKLQRILLEQSIQTV